MRVMDSLIVLLVACAVVLPVTLASASDSRRQGLELVVAGVALAGCVLLLGWMSFADGAHSSIWRWLPPFWPWGRIFTGPLSRWAIVVLLVFGTLLGIFYARTQP